MVTDILGADDEYLSLAEVVSSAARRASDVQLALYIVAGASIVTAALIFHPIGWHLFAAFGVTAGAFGGLGIADRELRDVVQQQGVTRIGWKALRFVASFAAGAGALFFLFAVLAVLVGTWKS